MFSVCIIFSTTVAFSLRAVKQRVAYYPTTCALAIFDLCDSVLFALLLKYLLL